MRITLSVSWLRSWKISVFTCLFILFYHVMRNYWIFSTFSFVVQTPFCALQTLFNCSMHLDFQWMCTYRKFPIQNLLNIFYNDISLVPSWLLQEEMNLAKNVFDMIVQCVSSWLFNCIEMLFTISVCFVWVSVFIYQFG